MDSDLKQLFRGTELPRDMLDIEKELKKIGEKPLTDTAREAARASRDQWRRIQVQVQGQEEAARHHEQDQAHEQASARTVRELEHLSRPEL